MTCLVRVSSGQILISLDWPFRAGPEVHTYVAEVHSTSEVHMVSKNNAEVSAYSDIHCPGVPGIAES